MPAALCRDVTAFLLACRRYLKGTSRPSAVPLETAELGGFGHERRPPPTPRRALMSHGGRAADRRRSRETREGPHASLWTQTAASGGSPVWFMMPGLILP